MKRLVKDLKKLSERVSELKISEDPELANEINNTLVEYLEKHTDVLAVTSNQFGYDYRAFAIRFGDDIRVFFNGMIVKQEGFHISIETNASLPGQRFLMPRNDSITLDYQNVGGRYLEYEFKGTEAELVQQQVQLTDGLMINDIGLEIFEDFDEATDEERQELIDFYVKTIKERHEAAQTEIENDPELKKRDDAVKFLIAAAKGEVKLYREGEEEVMSNRKKRKLSKIMKRINHIGKNFTKKKKKK